MKSNVTHQPVNLSRRVVLQRLATGTVALVAVGTGLISSQVLAEWPADAFGADDFEKAKTDLFGSTEAEVSDKIKIKAPDIAENGAVVPISAAVDMEGVESISFFVNENPSPLAASFELGEGALAEVSTRLKMGKTTALTCIVKVGDKLYSATKEIKVTIGGCGG